MPAETLDEIFARTLSDDYESDTAWDAVRSLRELGNRNVFEQAAEWCSSQEPLKRARGADILAQIGKTPDHPDNSFPDESFAVVSDMLMRETECLPLASAIHAMGHIDNPRAVSLIIRYQSHPNANVRFAVACSLGRFANDPVSVATLIELMDNADADVRDWATFGLGVQGNQDSPQIRDALAARLNDPCDAAREEAMVGLAMRRDMKVLSPLIASLESASVPDCALEAAYEMLGLENKEDEGWTATNYAAALRRRFRV